MTGIDQTEVQVAPFGRIWVAPVGTAGPTNVGTALNAAFTDLGYADENGVTVTPNVTVTDHFMWQSIAPVLQTLDKVTVEISFMLGQTNRAVTDLFFFGATWVNGVSGNATLTIPSAPAMSGLEVALVVEFADRKAAVNTINNRLYFPHATVTDRDPIKLVRSDVIKYGVKMSVQDSSGTLGQWISTNDDLYS